MKVWKGLEKEIKIFQGLEMLFIQGKEVDVKKVLELAKENEIYNLYFGAGKTELESFEELGLIPDEYEVIVAETRSTTTNIEKLAVSLKDMAGKFKV